MKTIFIPFALIFLFTTQLATAQPGYVALYTFAGNGNDASGNGYNGTLHGGATITTDLNIGDNASDYFSIPNATVNGLHDFTISFRFKLNSIHNAGAFPANTFMHAWGSDFNQDGLKISFDGPNNEFQVSINTVEYVGIYQFAANTWYRVKVVRSGSTLSMYVEQNLIASFSNVSTAAIQAVSNGVTVGQEQDCQGGCFAQNQSMNGSMGRLAILNFAQFRQESNQEMVPSAVEVYPNPASDQIIISGLSDAQKYSIDLISANGNLVRQEVTSSNSELNIGTADLPAGIYLVRLSEENTLVTEKKIVIQR